ncbi:MAG: DUF1844 domain-containing protein, partial [Pyrinomonadaceae bacterium]
AGSDADVPTQTAAVETASAPAPAAPARGPVAEPAGTPAQPVAATAGAGVRPAPEAEADPTAFANLLMFVASPAAAALGLTEHPGMGPEDIDLPLAKHCIDLIDTLRQKTRGNLGPQETQMLEGLLGELRMQYVSLTGTQPATPIGKGPRGFTGGDITGGG